MQQTISQKERVIHENVIPNKDLPIRFDVYTATGEYIPMHWHKSLEIVYVMNGAMEVVVNEKHFSLLSGEFIIINSGQIHATNGMKESTIFLIQLPYSFMNNHFPDYDLVQFEDYHGQFSFPGESPLIPIFDEMAALHTSKHLADTLRLTSLVYALLAEMTNNYMIHISSDQKIKNDKNLARLTEIIHFVQNHYAENLSLTDAANLLHLDKAYFCRFFKKNMGQTYLEYVNSIRMIHMYEQLITTNDSISTILLKTGFTNYKSFMSLFKKTYGATPLQIRKKSNQKSDQKT